MSDAYLGIAIALSASGLTAFSLLLQKYIRRKEANNPSNPSILEEESFSDLHRYCLSTISFLLLFSGYLLDALSINYLSLSIVGVLTTSQLVFGAILACALANEQIGVWGWVGIVSMTLGTVVMVAASFADHKDSSANNLMWWWIVVGGIVGIGLLWLERKPLDDEAEGQQGGGACLLAVSAGVLAADTLLLSKLILTHGVVGISLLLFAVAVFEVFIQLHLVRGAFGGHCGHGGLNSSATVISIFSVSTVVATILCGALVYGEFNGDPPSIALFGFGLALTIAGIHLLACSRAENGGDDVE